MEEIKRRTKEQNDALAVATLKFKKGKKARASELLLIHAGRPCGTMDTQLTRARARNAIWKCRLTRKT